MADAAETDDKTAGAALAPAFPIKLLIIVSAIALLFGVGGAVVAVKFFVVDKQRFVVAVFFFFVVEHSSFE